MDLRAKIAEVIAAAEGRYDNADADTLTDAVMGVVKAEHGGQKCVRFDIYEAVCGQMHDTHEEAEALKARLAAVRAVERELAGSIDPTDHYAARKLRDAMGEQ